MAASQREMIEHSRKLIATDGFFFQEDGAKGAAAEGFSRKAFPITTVDGLEFCKEHIFNEARISGLIEAIFEWSALSVYTCLRPFPKCAHAFVNDASVNDGLIVMMLSRGSELVFYKGSQHLPLEKYLHHYEMLEVPFEHVKDCEDIMVMAHAGGFVVFDVRLAFTISKGFGITFLFATGNVLANCDKMRLPYSAELHKLVTDIGNRSHRIGTNFTFDD